MKANPRLSLRSIYSSAWYGEQTDPSFIMALPMPEPTNPPLPLSKYRVLSFDIYGSIIQYKQHILTSFTPLLSRLPSSSPYLDPTPSSASIPAAATLGSISFLKLFQKHEDTIKLELATKPRRFDEILSEIWSRIAVDIQVTTTDEEAKAFGSESNVASWPVFPGSFEALNTLSKYYKLVALSNIDNFAWEITSTSTAASLGDVDWWKVFTAEDFGADMKRADDAKLETLVSYCTENGVKKEEILHIAQSLGHDQAPAKKHGLSSVWLIGDGPVWGKEEESKMALEKELVGYAWRSRDLKAFAAVVESDRHT